MSDKVHNTFRCGQISIWAYIHSTVALVYTTADEQPECKYFKQGPKFAYIYIGHCTYMYLHPIMYMCMYNQKNIQESYGKVTYVSDLQGLTSHSQLHWDW